MQKQHTPLTRFLYILQVVISVFYMHKRHVLSKCLSSETLNYVLRIYLLPCCTDPAVPRQLQCGLKLTFPAALPAHKDTRYSIPEFTRPRVQPCDLGYGAASYLLPPAPAGSPSGCHPTAMLPKSLHFLLFTRPQAPRGRTGAPRETGDGSKVFVWLWVSIHTYQVQVSCQNN